jgi:flavin reductase (DIM6/NTAB) family NADH-FMN oxidoreductase RutF
MSALRPLSLDPITLRRALGQFPQGVVAIAAVTADGPEVMVASSFTVGVSHEPPLVTVAIQHSSTTWPRLRDEASLLGITTLGHDHTHLARQLASRNRERRFDGVPCVTDGQGAITLEDSPLWLKATVHGQVAAGDHDIVILEIRDIGFDDGKSGMVFHQGQFRGLSE